MRYSQLCERVLNLFKPEEKTQVADEVWEILQSTYAKMGGFKSVADINELINQTLLWKCVRRNGKITAVGVYSDKHGRKSIASGTDGSEQGKRDYLMIKNDDIRLKRMWAEVSGPVERILSRSGLAPIPNKYASLLTGKNIIELNPDGIHYTRLIAGEPHEKAIYGSVLLDHDTVEKLLAQGVSLQDLPDSIQLKN